MIMIFHHDANVKYIKKVGSFRCQPCKSGTYTLNNGSLHLSTIFQGKQNIVPENTKHKFHLFKLSCWDELYCIHHKQEELLWL